MSLSAFVSKQLADGGPNYMVAGAAATNATKAAASAAQAAGKTGLPEDHAAAGAAHAKASQLARDAAARHPQAAHQRILNATAEEHDRRSAKHTAQGGAARDPKTGQFKKDRPRP